MRNKDEISRRVAEQLAIQQPPHDLEHLRNDLTDAINAASRAAANRKQTSPEAAADLERIAQELARIANDVSRIETREADDRATAFCQAFADATS